MSYTSHAVEKIYLQKVADGIMSPDDSQHALVIELDKIRIACWNSLFKKKSILARISCFLRGLISRQSSSALISSGLYLYGEVGRGKTALIDMFVATCQGPLPDGKSIWRLHFHDFILRLHERIAYYRQQGQGDPIKYVAGEWYEQTSVFVLDELHLTTIADAILFGRFLQLMIEYGCFFFLTSNKKPEFLYQGINQELFSPYIGILQKRMVVFSLDHPQDYRKIKMHSDDSKTLYILEKSGESAVGKLQTLWEGLGGRLADSVIKHYNDQSLFLRTHDLEKRMAWVSFMDLCSIPIGIQEYREFIYEYDIIFVNSIPRQTQDCLNQAVRWRNFIDILYDEKKALICSGACPIELLFASLDSADQFARTASRLIELSHKNIEDMKT